MNGLMVRTILSRCGGPFTGVPAAVIAAAAFRLAPSKRAMQGAKGGRAPDQQGGSSGIA